MMGMSKAIEIANGHTVGEEQTCLGRKMLCTGAE